MHIANPIYDVVFKYLMEDSQIAKMLIGKIIGREILDLSPRPQEVIVTKDQPKSFTVYRLDYSATIKTPDGSYKVIIEIQKAKLITDIMRFRRYLGKQYGDNENIYEQDGQKRALPIISIYFLGYSISDIPGPVLDIRRICTDRATNEIYPINNEFIESLTHDCYIIQINRLKEKRRTELEIMLSVFDQDTRSSDHHILNVREEMFEEKYRPLIRRLQRAAETEEVRLAMDVEDDVFGEMADFERKIEEKDKTIAEISKKAEEFSKKAEEFSKKAEEKDKTIEEKDKTIEEKDKIIAELMKRCKE